MEMGEIIKKLRLEKGITQEKLGEIIGVQKSAIRKYESGKVQNMKRSSIKKMADYFGVSPSYLMGLSDNPKVDSNTEAPTLPSEHIVFFDELGKICAGYDGGVDEIPTGRKIPIPSSMLNGRVESEFFTLRVSGNSMYPRILEGDTIFCLRTDSVDSGDIAVVIYDGEDATVKKVNYVSGEDWLELIPFNPEYPTKRIEGADLEICHIQGKVVKLIRDV